MWIPTCYVRSEQALTISTANVSAVVEGSALNTCVQATVGLPNTPSTDTDDR